MDGYVLTPEEAAGRLKVEPKTIREWLRRGVMTGVRLGRLWRIREEDMARFLGRAQSPDHETLLWLRSGGHAELPPYDWGKSGPPAGRPIRYVPGEGFMVED